METRWLWPFELTEKLGEGGMGTVYRARYSGNNRQVAVKLLPPEVASDTVLLARFERELDVLKQLRHPHIVRCFGGTCETEQRFYAMELVEGGTLGDLLMKKTLSWEVVVDYALQMCEALQYAHEHGVIHRDIKPGNFLLTKSGQIKLSDFGLASIATTNRLTASGRTVGTIQYMAPEQIRGKPALTHRADLYALGCVLYEMLTGQPPFPGDNAATVLQAHLKTPAPHAMAMILDCPLKLDQLICELMSKDAEQRPASAAEVGFRLEEILQPGRRVTAVEPDLFTPNTARTLVVSPLQNVAATPSDSDLDVYTAPTTTSRIPWIIAAASIAIGIVCWMGWSSSAAHLHQAEKTMTEMLGNPDTGRRLFAVQALAEFGPLSSATIEKLRAATKDGDPNIRSAALSTLTRHAAECRWMQTEFLQIEKVDENPDVRHQAGLALEATKQARTPFSMTHFIMWGLVLVGIAGAMMWAKTAWKRFQLSAA